MADWDFLLIVLLLSDEEDTINKYRIHSRYRKDFLKSLDIDQRRLRYRKIPRCCLQNPSESAWRKLYSAQNDQGMITLTGFDCASFAALCVLFAPVFDSYTPFVPSGTSCFEREKLKNKGRKRMIRPEDGLGLVLAWTRTRGSLMALQLIFGMTYSNLDDYLLYGKRIIVKVLRNDPRSSVKIPSSERIAEYKEMVSNRHPYLTDVWCTMDGLKLTLQQSGDALIQERYYNGWTHDHYVSSVLCFCPDGTIPIAYINIPGSVHDSQIADYGSIYDKLESVYDRDGAQCTVDSAFGNITRVFLIKSSQELIHIDNHVDRQIARDATSMRQSAEWGMHAFQSSMPRIKDRMVFEERGERKVTLCLMILLYNLRANLVGINQLTSFYAAPLTRDANLDFVP
jgi:DDE superfamily endonuclease